MKHKPSRLFQVAILSLLGTLISAQFDSDKNIQDIFGPAKPTTKRTGPAPTRAPITFPQGYTFNRRTAGPTRAPITFPPDYTKRTAAPTATRAPITYPPESTAAPAATQAPITYPPEPTAAATRGPITYPPEPVPESPKDSQPPAPEGPLTTPRPELPIEYCATQVCNDTADYLRDSIDTSVDPCKSVYEFSCNGWHAKNPLGPIRRTHNRYQEVRFWMRHQTAEILLALDPHDESEGYNIRYAAHFYQRCIAAENQTQEEGLESVAELYSHIYELIDEKKSLADLWLYSIFRANQENLIFKIGADLKVVNNRYVETIMIQPATFRLNGAAQIFGDLSSSKRMKNLLNKIAEIVCRRETPGKCTAEAIADAVDRLFVFEKALEEYPMEKGETFYTQKDMTLGELDFHSGFEFTDLVKRMYSMAGAKTPVDTSTVFAIKNPSFFSNFMKVIRRTDRQTLLAYFGYKVLLSNAMVASEPFRKDEDEEYGKYVPAGEWDLQWYYPTREEYCIRFLKDRFPESLMQLFAEKFFTDRDKEVAEEFFSTFKEGANELLRTASWLDDGTRAKGIRSIDDAAYELGYDQGLRNDTHQDINYFWTKEVFDKAVAELNPAVSYMKYREHRRSLSVRWINEELPRLTRILKSYAGDPGFMSAAISPSTNKIYLPVGLLVHPFFVAGRPMAMNYGGVGFHAGHELAHSLDWIGSGYNDYGGHTDWSARQRINNYYSRAKNCLVRQFNARKEPTTGKMLNGRALLSENIADGGGIKIAFNIFQKMQAKEGKEVRLAGLPEYSSEQLFFMSFGAMNCKVNSVESMLVYLSENHSPQRDRVEASSFNFDGYYDTFKCPKDESKMCKIW